jgi:hypothetical protein
MFIPASLQLLILLIVLDNFSLVLQQGRTAEAEAEFERLLGVSEAKFAMSQLSKVDRGEDTDTVKFSELLHGHHSKGI